MQIQSPTSAVDAAQAAAAASQSQTSTGAADPTLALANENTFLQLLVAQIKNQDPLQPTDGVQFLSQLAQFSSLEQLIGIRQEIQGIAPATPADSTQTNSAQTNSTQN
jgi:flagellar basal-body rod modification protein FlgD